MTKKQKNKFKTLVALCLLPAAAKLQIVTPYLGTKTPYTHQPEGKRSTAPAGYSPVFINYTGRHGARFMTKPGADIEMLALLSYAAEQNQLTETGKQLKVMTERFLSIEKDSYENISLLGAVEQEAIGKRFFDGYKQAFIGRGIDIEMTYKVRTQQSAAAFEKGLTSYAGTKKETILPEGKDETLRFYDLSPSYQNFKKTESLKRATDSLYADARTMHAAENICRKLFTAPLAQQLLQKNIPLQINKKTVSLTAVTVAENVYDLYAIQFSIPLEMKQHQYAKSDIDFSIAFEKQDLAWLDFISGAKDFLEKGPGTDTLGIQVKVAMPLLADYLNTTQDVIDKKRKTDGVFRFTHAEAISPFATLLGIRSVSKPATSIFSYQDNWQASSVIPLSANICWVLYYNGKDYLVKILLNEKEVAVPVPTTQFPFYKWQDLKAYYTNKMKALQTSPSADMQQYLLDLK